MLRSHKCPKCESTDIVRVPGSKMYGDNYVITGFLSYALVTRYICKGCGFCEEYVESEDDRDKLEQRADRSWNQSPPEEGVV